MPLLATGVCDIGMKRKTNQDSIFVDAGQSLFIVADGMGGHNGGDIASNMAVNCVPEYFQDHLDQEPKEIVRDSIRHANNQIKKRGEGDPDLVGMGTTCVTFYFKGPTLYIGNVGDSRAYLVNNQMLFQLSRDHSLVQEKLNLGLYNREEAASDPHKNVLVRTVGFEDDVEVDVFTYKVHRNDIFLSCSDGLHGKVSDADILHIIKKYIPEPSKCSKADVDKAAHQLVAQANANGGNDNISVILVVAQ